MPRVERHLEWHWIVTTETHQIQTEKLIKGYHQLSSNKRSDCSRSIDEASSIQQAQLGPKYTDN